MWNTWISFYDFHQRRSWISRFESTVKRLCLTYLERRANTLKKKKMREKTKSRNDTLKATSDMAPRFNLDLVPFIYSSLLGAWESWLVHLSLVYETSSFFITVTIWRHEVLLSCICIKGSISTMDVQKASNDLINSEWLSLFLMWRKTKTCRSLSAMTLFTPDNYIERS